MTENEAKECIEELKQYNRNSELKTPVNNDVSMLWDGTFGIVLRLFEEIQQYRAIGTVEELKNMKENGAFTGGELAQIADMQKNLKKYQAIGTVDEFKALKEKSVAKKVKGISLTHESRVGNCPNCNQFVVEKYDKKCPKCRRKLDWSE